MTGRNVAALAAAGLLLGSLAGPGSALAQESPACAFQASGEELMNRASPPDSTAIRLGGQVAKVCYSSPRARGREIMGDLVPFGQPWRLGANEPTTLHLTFAADVGGVSLEPGSYVLYAIPGEDQWEIVANGATERWGIPIDESVRSEDIGSAAVTPEETDEMVENLTLRFEPQDESSAHLVVEWERTRLRIPVSRTDS